MRLLRKDLDEKVKITIKNESTEFTQLLLIFACIHLGRKVKNLFSICWPSCCQQVLTYSHIFVCSKQHCKQLLTPLRHSKKMYCTDPR